MVDVATYAFLTTSFFFVALGVALLARYRQVSKNINASTDLGHDLWSSLEQRLKRQDERILDVMGRLEVVQARVMAGSSVHAPSALSLLPVIAPHPPPAEESPRPVMESNPAVQQPGPQESQELQQPAASIQPMDAKAELDRTEKLALSLLSGGPLATPDILKGLINQGGPRSREHAARLMKELFEKRLDSRNSTSKPFVYQLTEEGRRRLQ